MTRREPDRLVDVATLTEDDRLLDRIGRGEPVGDADDVAVLLSRWRASLPDTAPADDQLPAAAVSTRPRSSGRFARRLLSVAAASVLVFGAVTIAAADAAPDSPLWPITRLMFPDRAGSTMAVQAAERAVTGARAAADQGRFDEATRLLDEAAAQLGKINEPAAAQRLRAELDAVRALIAHKSGDLATDSAAPGVSPTSTPAQPSTATVPPTGVPSPGLSAVPVPEQPPATGATTPLLPTVPVLPSVVPLPLIGRAG